jgi:hypothetical protein
MFKKKKIVEKIKTHFITNNVFFSENSAVYEIMWRNVIKLDKPQITI